MNKFQAILVFFLLFRLSSGVNAQSVNGSPYSVFGIGDRMNKGFGKSLGLGGIGIGLRDAFSLNNVNPASYTAISAPFTQLTQFGLGVTVGERQEAGESSAVSDLSFSGIAFWFRTNEKSAISFGLAPYTKVGYNLEVTQLFTGTSSENTVTYGGSGGLNQLYAGVGYDLFKHFSAGIHASYIFGPLKEEQQITESAYVNDITIDKNLFLSTFNLDFGLQYVIPIRKSTLTLGAVYDYKSKLKSNYTVKITETSGSETETTEETSEVDEDYILPTSFGGGLSWQHKNKWILMADATFEQWDRATFAEGYSLRNSQRVSTGFSLLPDRASESFFGSVGLDMGVFYENTYLKINGVGIIKSGFSFGLNIPVSKTILELSFQQSYRKPEGNSKLISEKYSQINLNISLFDIWFKQPKYD